MRLRPPRSTRTDPLFPSTTLVRSRHPVGSEMRDQVCQCLAADADGGDARAFAHESLDAGAAHAGRGGGDDGELAVQTHGIGPQLAKGSGKVPVVETMVVLVSRKGSSPSRPFSRPQPLALTPP